MVCRSLYPIEQLHEISLLLMHYPHAKQEVSKFRVLLQAVHERFYLPEQCRRFFVGPVVFHIDNGIDPFSTNFDCIGRVILFSARGKFHPEMFGTTALFCLVPCGIRFLFPQEDFDQQGMVWRECPGSPMRVSALPSRCLS